MDRAPGQCSASVLGVVACVSLACVGDIAERPGAGLPDDTTPAPAAEPAPGGGAPAPAATPAATTGGIADGFLVPTEQLQLLPFSVRFSRLVHVVGARESDPMFETLRRSRTALGDHDYANGVKPDNTWSALRLSEWVRALKPVCASQAMRARYPALPDALGALVEAAYGRAMRPEDLTAVRESLSGLSLDEKARYEAICAAVLSSLEFLAQ